MTRKPVIVAFDLEGCLVPEIWIGLAEKTGIQELKLTTRDIPDYDELMSRRLGILKEHGLGMRDIQDVIGQMQPLPGARDFLERIRSRYQFIILSDTFYEFAAPLMEQLDRPTLFCHTLDVAADGTLSDYHLRTKDGKRGAVQGFQSNGFFVTAVGDSFNDTSMLTQADCGLLLHAPDNVITDFPQFRVCRDYAEVEREIDRSLSGQ